MKKILIIVIPIFIIVGVILISLLSTTTPISELERIVNDNDCDAFERWDVKYNEGYGLDIPQELFSKALKLAYTCTMGTVNDVIKDVLDDMNG